MGNIIAVWNYIKMWWIAEREIVELFENKKFVIDSDLYDDDYNEVVHYAGGCPNYNRQGQ